MSHFLSSSSSDECIVENSFTLGQPKVFKFVTAPSVGRDVVDESSSGESNDFYNASTEAEFTDPPSEHNNLLTDDESSGKEKANKNDPSLLKPPVSTTLNMSIEQRQFKTPSPKVGKRKYIASSTKKKFNRIRLLSTSSSEDEGEKAVSPPARSFIKSPMAKIQELNSSNATSPLSSKVVSNKPAICIDLSSDSVDNQSDIDETWSQRPPVANSTFIPSNAHEPIIISEEEDETGHVSFSDVSKSTSSESDSKFTNPSDPSGFSSGHTQSDKAADAWQENSSAISNDSGAHSKESPKRKLLQGYVPINLEVDSDTLPAQASKKKFTQGYVPININSEEVVELTIDERNNELLAEKKRLEFELIGLSTELQALKVSMKNINFHELPDGGAGLSGSVYKKEKEINSLRERISYIDSRLRSLQNGNQFGQPIQPSTQVPSWNDKLPSSNTNLKELGKKALERHRAEQAVTMDALTRLHKALEMRPKEGDEVDDPPGLKVPLLPHQRQALAWLLWREKQKPSGGILADDMGLGKTLTMISLIVHGKHQTEKETQLSDSNDSGSEEASNYFFRKPPKGGTLVICPSSVMGQWEGEILNRVQKRLLTISLHHGAKREKKSHRLAKFDVVITTYAILQKTYKDIESGPLTSVQWTRVILDEGHVIRNHKSQTAQAICRLRANHRWVLTGTPVHNKELDFYSLLRFLKCKPFDDYGVWKKWVDNKDAAGMQRLNCITKSLLLRRTKEGIQEKGGLSNLKPKEFNRISVDLDPEESAVYEKIAHFSSTLLAQFIFQKAEKEQLLDGGISIYNSRQLREIQNIENPFKDHPELARLHQNMISMKDIQTHQILVLLLRLRQICCHPSLISQMLDQEDLQGADVVEDEVMDPALMQSFANLSIMPEDVEEEGDEESSKPIVLSSKNPVFKKSRVSSKMRSVINCLKEILENKQDKVIVVSQWTSVLFILDEFLKFEGIDTVGLNGTVPVKERGKIVHDFNKESRGPRVMLLSLTAGGTGLNLVGANHLLLIDIHWNPQLEAQASDRIYRVGQMKNVTIYKFICAETIEERIEKLQEKKLLMASNILSGSMKVQSSKLTIDDLKLLFNFK